MHKNKALPGVLDSGTTRCASAAHTKNFLGYTPHYAPIKKNSTARMSCILPNFFAPSSISRLQVEACANKCSPELKFFISNQREREGTSNLLKLSDANKCNPILQISLGREQRNKKNMVHTCWRNTESTQSLLPRR